MLGLTKRQAQLRVWRKMSVPYRCVMVPWVLTTCSNEVRAAPFFSC